MLIVEVMYKSCIHATQQTVMKDGDPLQVTKQATS